MENAENLFNIFIKEVDTHELNKDQLVSFNKLVEFWNDYNKHDTEYLWTIKNYHSSLASKYYTNPKFIDYITSTSSLRVKILASSLF